VNRHQIVFTALGFECVGLIASLAFLGSWLDEKYGWTGAGVAGGVFVGLIAWLIHVVLILRMQPKGENTGNPEKP